MVLHLKTWCTATPSINPRFWEKRTAIHWLSGLFVFYEDSNTVAEKTVYLFSLYVSHYWNKLTPVLYAEIEVKRPSVIGKVVVWFSVAL